MNEIFSVFLLVSSTILVGYLFRLHKNYFEDLERIEEDIADLKAPLKELFFVGIGIVDIVQYKFEDSFVHSKRNEIEELDSEGDAEFGLYLLIVSQVTYLYIGILLTIFVTVLSGEVKMLFIGLLASGFSAYYPWYNVGFQVRKQREELLADFHEVLSKLALLTNAGLTLRDAWTTVSYSNEKPLYKELQTTCVEISNGMDEEIAYLSFAKRCSSEEIRKFISIIIQNRKKGSNDVARSLKRMTYDSMELRKHEARRLGKIASQKMLTPILMIFLGILLLVIVPLLSSTY